MLENYKPQDRNYHYIRVTFANADYVGQAILKVSGDCKGASVLSEGLDFWENCDTEDIENLVHSDCQLSLYKGDYDEYWFKITLRKLGTRETMYLEELDYQELTDMIIAVEFVRVEPAEDSK